MLQKKQKSLSHAERAFGIEHQNNFKNMIVKIDMNVPRILRLILRTNEAVNWQKIKNNQPQLKIS